VGAIGIVGAGVLMLIFGGVAGILGSTGDPDARIAMPILGITGVALVMVLLVRSLPGVIVGIGLLKFRAWARIGGIVLSILDLIWIPFGTVVGIYGLWVLFSPETERWFSRPVQAPPAS
jgi:hypothetical protein